MNFFTLMKDLLHIEKSDITTNVKYDITLPIHVWCTSKFIMWCDKCFVHSVLLGYADC